MSKNKKNKNKKKKSKQDNKKLSEKKIIISIIVALVIWFVMSNFTKNNNKDEILNITKISESIESEINNNLQKGGQQNMQPPKKTYNILNTGINIPKDGLTIPDVLIDYV